MLFTQSNGKDQGEATIFVCGCHQPNHCMRLWVWDDLFSFEIALNAQYTFLRRLKAAFSYLFRRGGWQFEDVMLTRHEIEAFRDQLTKYLQNNPKELDDRSQV